MVYLAFPYGSNFGWGVLGKEVALAMARLTDVRLLAPPATDQRLDDEFDRFLIQRMLANGTDPSRNGTAKLDGPVIQAVVGRGLEPFVHDLPLPAEIGYAVFEETKLPPPVIANSRRQYRHLCTASTYCAEILRGHGLTDVSVLPHGVDTDLFHPRSEPRSFLPDRFIVFSGGKFELRKGQDIVIRAYKILQDRHRDVMLVNSWHNNWPKHRDTMASSAIISYFPPVDDDHCRWMNALLHFHGIDVERVITVGPRDHRLLPALYHSTDLGIFPNRAEGGNNMVLMEYLACGRPALASFNSGHTDIVRRQNAVLIENHRPMEIRNSDEVATVLSDPSLDETVAKLEWCYQNRDQLRTLAQQGAADMREFSWRRLAEGFLSTLRQIS